VPSIAASLAGHRSQTFSEAAELLDAIICYLVQGELRGDIAGYEHILNAVSASGAGNGDSTADGDAAWLPAGLAGQLCLNINIPDLTPAAIKGLRWCKAGHRDYEDVVSVSRDPNGREYYWLGGTKVLAEDLPDSDTLAITEGYISLTPVTYDITQYADLGRLERWFAERYLNRGGQNRHG